MLPDAVTKGGCGITVQLGLGQQPAQIAGQHIAAAALRQERVAGAVEEDTAFTAPDQRLVALEHHPTVAVAPGQFAHRSGAVGLDFLRRAFQKPRCLGGMGCEGADGFWRGRCGGEPIQRAGIGQHWQREFLPQVTQLALQVGGQIARRQARAEQDRAAGIRQFHTRPPGADHGRLQLAGDGLVNAFLDEQRDQSGLGAQRAAGGQNGGAMIAQASSDDHEMTEGSLVSVHGARGREAVEILRQGPLHIAFVRAGDKADVWGDFEATDERPGRGLEQAFFRGPQGERDRGTNGCAFGFAGVSVQTGGHINRQHRHLRPVDLFDQFHPGAFQRTVESDAEQTVDDQSRREGEEGIELLERRLRNRHVDQRDFAIRKVLSGLARIVAVVPFAGQNEDQIARAGELFGARSDEMSDAADDLRRAALGRPGGLLPFAHLGDADDGNWHR